MFSPNLGSGSWPVSIRGAHGNGCYGAQSDPETTLVWGLASVPSAQGSTALSGRQGRWPRVPSQSAEESQAGAAGWGCRPPGPSAQEVTGVGTTRKEAGAPLQGDVSSDAQAEGEEPASPERRACWQRRGPGAGLAEASGHGDLGAEGPWAPEGRACWEKAGEGGGDHGCARRGSDGTRAALGP